MQVCASVRLLFMEVFVPQDLVQDPVEDVEEEEGQGEAGPGNSVDLLGPVDEELPHLLGALAPAARCSSRRRLGGVGRASRGVERGVVVGADLEVFAVAGGGGHGGCGGQPALIHVPFLLGFFFGGGGFGGRGTEMIFS